MASRWSKLLNLLIGLIPNIIGNYVSRSQVKQGSEIDRKDIDMIHEHIDKAYESLKTELMFIKHLLLIVIVILIVLGVFQIIILMKI